MQEERGFLSALLDPSFSSLITKRVLGVLYIIVLVLFTLAAVGYFIFGLVMLFKQPAVGLGVMVATPIAYVLYVILIRIWFEVIIVLFNIAENTGETARLLAGGAVPSPAPPPAPAAPLAPPWQPPG